MSEIREQFAASSGPHIDETSQGHSVRPAFARSVFRIGDEGSDVVAIDHRRELDQDWLDDLQRLAEALHDLCTAHGAILRVQLGPRQKILTDPPIEYEDD